MKTPLCRCVGLVCLSAACSAGPSSNAAPTATAGPTTGGVRTNAVQSFYDVEGSTASQLLADMLEHGPGIGGLPVFATNEWEVRWRMRPARRSGQCQLERVEVELHITTVLPRWNAPAAATPELRQKWTAFLAALNAHEAGHLDLGIRAARTVLDRLRRVRGLRDFSCDALIAEANAVAQRTLADYHDRNLRYDVDTRHGATQGVHWPPLSITGSE